MNMGGWAEKMGISEQIVAKKPFVSLEFFPPRTEDLMPAFHQNVTRLARLNPLFVAVTCGAGGSGARGTMAVARDLRAKYTFTVMPHMICVGNSHADVSQQVQHMRQCGINNVLALRGDFPQGMDAAPHDLRHASDLVRKLRSEDDALCVGVAAYPDAHPESLSIAEDIAHLQNKLEQGADFAVTQLFFDNRKYFDMVERLLARGCSKVVIPSILPIRSLGQVRRLMELCSTPIPGKLLSSLEQAHSQGGEPAVRRVGAEFAAAQIRDLVAAGAPGVHLYPFNRAGLCLEVVERAGLMPDNNRCVPGA